MVHYDDAFWNVSDSFILVSVSVSFHVVLSGSLLLPALKLFSRLILNFSQYDRKSLILVYCQWLQYEIIHFCSTMQAYK